MKVVSKENGNYVIREQQEESDKYRIYKYVNNSWQKTSYAGNYDLICKIMDTLRYSKTLLDMRRENK